MPNHNPINGITLHKDSENGVYICYVEDFSDELKGKIREMLSSVWNGSVDAIEDEDIYNYKMTLKDF